MTGPILASRLSYIDPYGAFNPLVSFEVVVIAILGGSGDAFGPILGSILITTLSELLSSAYPYEYEIFLGVILVVVVFAAPRGLSGLYSSIGKIIRGTGSADKMKKQE
jgi:branched-chain amino acid transport system permease protein